MIEIRADSRDLARLNVDMNRLAESTGKTLKEVLPSQMRLLAVDLAKVTLPRSKASKKSMDNVKGRIAAIYLNPGSVVNKLKTKNEGAAGSFADHISKRNYNKAQSIVTRYLPGLNIRVGAFDGGALHRKQRSDKKITQRLCVPGYSRVKAYANKTALKVGFAKGGFAAAARQLGGVRGIPGFATRQKSPGRGIVAGDGTKLSVTMINDVSHIRHALPKGSESAAIAHRSKQVGSVLQRIQDRKIKQIMRR